MKVLLFGATAMLQGALWRAPKAVLETKDINRL
jgi:hypothetical protein